MKAGMKKELLAQLDAAHEEYSFPMFDNANYPAVDMRLTAFRGDDEWLVVFQSIVNAIHQGNELAFLLNVFAFGNKVEAPGVCEDKPIVTPVRGAPIWDDDAQFLLDLHDFSVKINGTTVSLTPSDKDYAKEGISRRSRLAPQVKLLRYLVAVKRELFFLSDRALLASAGRGRLTRFLELDDWQHPGLDDDDEPAAPSSVPCFQALAEALENDDPSRYRCQKRAMNIHWSHWPLLDEFVMRDD